MAEEDRGFNILSRYKKNVAWKIKDTYTSVPDKGTEYGTWGKGKSPQDYGINYERRLNPIEHTEGYTNVQSEPYPYNAEGDFHDPTATNYSRDANIKKQKDKSKLRQKFQTKGKQKLLSKQLKFNESWGDGSREFQKMAKPGWVTTKDKFKQVTGKKLPQYQTKGKQSLLTKQPTRSKGGGSPGGGGKWGWFNRMKHSPWNLLKNDKSY